MLPAAQTTTSRGSPTRVDGADHLALGGQRSVSEACRRARPSPSHSAASARARSACADSGRPAREAPRAAPPGRRGRRPTSGRPRCLAASTGATLMLTKRTSGSAKRLREAVVKSLQRVPTPSTRSASRASALAAVRAGRADGADGTRVVVGQRALAGLRLGDRDAGGLGAARPARRSRRRRSTPPPATISGRCAAAEQVGGLRQRLGLGRGPAHAPDAALEELVRPVVGLGLHVLRERERDRAGLGRVGQHAHRRRAARRDELLGPLDAVEEARDRRSSRSPTRRRRAGCSSCCSTGLATRVAKRSPGSSRTGRRLTVASAAPVTMFVAPGPIEVVQASVERRSLCRAYAAAVCTMRLLVARQVVGQPGPGALGLEQRLADAGDVAVPEDPEAAGDEALLRAVALGVLVGQEAHERLASRSASCGPPRARSSAAAGRPTGRPRCRGSRRAPGRR